MQVHGMICSVLGQTMETHGVEVYRPAVSIMGQRGYGLPPWILINTVGYRKSPKKKKIWLVVNTSGDQNLNRTTFEKRRLLAPTGRFQENTLNPMQKGAFISFFLFFFFWFVCSILSYTVCFFCLTFFLSNSKFPNFPLHISIMSCLWFSHNQSGANLKRQRLWTYL